MKTKTKYYLGYYENEEATIVHIFKMNGVVWCVVDTEDCYKVCKKADLITYKQTKHYKRKQELKKEIEELEKEKDKKVKEIQDEAIKSLVTRVKLNVAFGNFSDDTSTLITLKIIEELKKLIKENNEK